ncbi:MAG: RDD family protein [Victivallales bacterium]|nr:RDD family protein [Victivallales bacterium]
MAANWYFEENGERVGPHDDAEIKDAVTQGRISANTLVWNEKMADWTKASDAGLVSYSAPTAPTTVETTPTATGDEAVEVVEISEEPYPVISPSTPEPVAGNVEIAQCANCGGMFNSDELVDIDGAPVCADCKPQYLRKLQEGGEVNNIYFLYAGFWIRGGALFIDGIILNIIQMPISFVIGLIMGGTGATLDNNSGAGLAVFVVLQIINISISIIVPMLYYVFFLVKKGATPGKMALGLRIINADGSREISYGKAFGRYFAKMLSSLTLCIGYMMAGWDDEKRALHDRICSTRVIYSK